MGEHIGKIAAGIFSVLVMFYMIISSLALKQEYTTQTYVDNAVQEFVDNARAAGKISDDAYEHMIFQLDQVVDCCRVEIELESKYCVLDDTGTAQTYLFTNTKDEILDYIYTETGENRDYALQIGDFLKVTVYNETPTFATRICRLVLPNYNPNNASIFFTYSGFVGNNIE